MTDRMAEARKRAATKGAATKRATQRRPPQPPPPDTNGDGQAVSDRPTIIITTAERAVDDQAVAAIAGYPGIYQRGSLLVRVTRDAQAPRGIRRPDAPHISALPRPILQEALAD